MTTYTLKTTDCRESIESIILHPYNSIKKESEVMNMQVEIKIDSSYTEPKILILTNSVTEDINNIVKKLSEDVPQIISGSRENKIELLDPA